MQKSLNTDLMIKGQSFHVQTEDWGQSHQKLVTRVYRHGQMVKSFELPYNKISFTNLSAHQTLEALDSLHQKVIDWVRTEM